jgi:hypothetical protein
LRVSKGIPRRDFYHYNIVSNQFLACSQSEYCHSFIIIVTCIFLNMDQWLKFGTFKKRKITELVNDPIPSSSTSSCEEQPNARCPFERTCESYSQLLVHLRVYFEIFYSQKSTERLRRAWYQTVLSEPCRLNSPGRWKWIYFSLTGVPKCERWMCKKLRPWLLHIKYY